jgi:mannosyltransferase
MGSPAIAAPQAQRQDRAPAAHRVVARWLPLIFGALAIGVYGVWYWNPAYRYDEYLVAVLRTRLSWSDLLNVIATADPGAGPLYLLMKPWTAISSDPAWTRIPSVIAMAVAVGGLVAFVRSALDTRTAVFAGFLMLFLPVTSRWAQDNRMYAPATACVVLAVGCWWRSVSGGSLRWSIGYGLAVTGLGLFHLYGLAVIPALVVAAMLVPGSRRSILLRTIVPPAIAFVVLLPHIYLNYAHPTGSPSNPPVSAASLTSILTASLGPFLFGLVALLAIGGSVWAWRDRDRRAMVALGLGWVLIPLVLFVAARVVLGIPTLSPRYYVVAIPGSCLLAACGLAALYARWHAAAIVAMAIIAVLAVPGQISVRTRDAHDPAGYRLARLLRQPALAGLPVVAANRHLAEEVDAATYPDNLIAPSTETPQPIAIVVAAGAAPRAIGGTPYLQPGGPWRPVVRCTPGAATVLIMATPEAHLPAADPRALARRLNASMPRANCNVEP